MEIDSKIQEPENEEQLLVGIDGFQNVVSKEICQHYGSLLQLS